VKNASLTVAPAPGPATSRDALLEPVAEALQPSLDADRLAREAAEQDRAEDVERARVAPRQREVEPDDGGHEPQPRQHALLQAGRQAAADEHADGGAGEHGAHVDERPRHAIGEDGTVGGH
jgi:hypothetical protein